MSKSLDIPAVQSILLFDLGNTRAKWALSSSGAIVGQGGFKFGADALAACFAQLAELLSKSEINPIESVAVCSVAKPVVLAELVEGVLDRWNIQSKIIKVTAEFGDVRNGYTDLQQLGVDRWVAVVGAAQLGYVADYKQDQAQEAVQHDTPNLIGQHFPEAKIIIDVGTAATIDYLSIDNQYLGGAILPGRDLMLNALNQNTANIDAGVEPVLSVFGKTTAECVNVGVQFGLNGAIASIIERMLEERPVPTRLLVCGGGAQSFIDHYQSFAGNKSAAVQHAPELVFTGLIALSS